MNTDLAKATFQYNIMSVFEKVSCWKEEQFWDETGRF